MRNSFSIPLYLGASAIFCGILKSWINCAVMGKRNREIFSNDFTKNSERLGAYDCLPKLLMRFRENSIVKREEMINSMNSLITGKELSGCCHGNIFFFSDLKNMVPEFCQEISVSMTAERKLRVLDRLPIVLHRVWIGDVACCCEFFRPGGCCFEPNWRRIEVVDLETF